MRPRRLPSLVRSQRRRTGSVGRYECARLSAMPSLRLILPTLLVLCASMAQAQSEEAAKGKPGPIRLRVLSYNVHHCQGTDRKLDLSRIAKVVKSVSPDLVALQEVDRKTRRSKGVDQAAQLAKLTGMNLAFGSNLKLQGGRYGNAVLSRFPISDWRNELLPRIKGGEQRGALLTHVKHPRLKDPIAFFSTHFDHRRAPASRLASAKAINGMVQWMKSSVILAGDLNTRPESEVMSELLKSWTSVSSKAQPTVPVEKPTKQIDFILYRRASQWKVVEVRVLSEHVASDHRALFAVLEAKGQALEPKAKK